MHEQHLRKKSQRLSWLLRHGANEVHLAMDSAGFAAVDDVLRHASMTRAELAVVIEENNTSRYQLTADGLRVRACQGHSLQGSYLAMDQVLEQVVQAIAVIELEVLGVAHGVEPERDFFQRLGGVMHRQLGYEHACLLWICHRMIGLAAPEQCHAAVPCFL